MSYINTTTPTRIWIGGKEYSEYLISGSVSDDSSLTNSVIKTTGSISLGGVHDSLVMREFPLPIGSQIVVQCVLPNNYSTRHPRGTLYLFNTTVNYEQQTVNLEVGCSLALASTYEPSFRDRIKKLFDLIPEDYSVFDVDEYDFSQLSQVLESLGYVMYQDKNGYIQCVKVFGDGGLLGSVSSSSKFTSYDDKTALSVESLSDSSTLIDPESLTIIMTYDIPYHEPDDPEDVGEASGGDIDKDGVPDRLDSDMDGDGIPNHLDPDIDGDGIPNEDDPYPSGEDSITITAPASFDEEQSGPPEYFTVYAVPDTALKFEVRDVAEEGKKATTGLNSSLISYQLGPSEIVRPYSRGETVKSLGFPIKVYVSIFSELDYIVEGEEQFQFVVNAGQRNEASIYGTITENDAEISVQASGDVDEELPNPAIFTVEASEGQPLTFTVEDVAEDGNAATSGLSGANIEYSLDNGITWTSYSSGDVIPAPKKPVLVSVNITAERDDISEGDEQFRLVVNKGEESEAFAFATIVDDEVEIYVQSRGEANEEIPGERALFDVRGREGTLLSFEVRDVAEAQEGEGEGTPPTEGMASAQIEYSLDNGETWTTYSGGSINPGDQDVLVGVKITPEQDDVEEGNEQFQLVVNPGQPSEASAFAIIADDETEITVTSAGNVDEEGVEPAYFDVNVNSAGPQTITLEVRDVAEEGKTATTGLAATSIYVSYTNGDHWISYTSGEEIPAPPSGSLKVKVNIDPERDDVTEGEEQFQLVVNAGKPSEAIGYSTITDDEAVISIDSSNSIDEDNPFAAIFKVKTRPGTSVTFEVDDITTSRIRSGSIRYSVDGGFRYRSYSGEAVVVGTKDIIVTVAINSESDRRPENDEVFKFTVNKGQPNEAFVLVTVNDNDEEEEEEEEEEEDRFVDGVLQDKQYLKTKMPRVADLDKCLEVYFGKKTRLSDGKIFNCGKFLNPEFIIDVEDQQEWNKNPDPCKKPLLDDDLFVTSEDFYAYEVKGKIELEEVYFSDYIEKFQEAEYEGPGNQLSYEKKWEDLSIFRVGDAAIGQWLDNVAKEYDLAIEEANAKCQEINEYAQIRDENNYYLKSRLEKFCLKAKEKRTMLRTFKFYDCLVATRIAEVTELIEYAKGVRDIAARGFNYFLGRRCISNIEETFIEFGEGGEVVKKVSNSIVHASASKFTVEAFKREGEALEDPEPSGPIVDERKASKLGRYNYGPPLEWISGFASSTISIGAKTYRSWPGYFVRSQTTEEYTYSRGTVIQKVTKVDLENPDNNTIDYKVSTDNSAAAPQQPRNGLYNTLKPFKDTDGDGIPDSEDPDIDGDGIPNEIDADADGDGIRDDLDDDGIPDIDDDDDDNDGIPDDAEDGDADGDGIPDSRDTDDDNDGIPDVRDTDDDNDGVPDGPDPDDQDDDGVDDKNDTDIDGDGISNQSDPDMDGDGVLNGDDPDIDGDGVLNEEDETPFGPDGIVLSNCDIPTESKEVVYTIKGRNTTPVIGATNSWAGTFAPAAEEISMPISFKPLVPERLNPDEMMTDWSCSILTNDFIEVATRNMMKYEKYVGRYLVIAMAKKMMDNRGIRIVEKMRPELFEYYPFMPITVALSANNRTLLARTSSATWAFDSTNALCSFDCYVMN